MVKISGGEGLAKALAEISKKIKTAASVEIGFLEDATYPDGTSVPMVAAIQEFGAPSRNIPPRPFFRNMVKDKAPEWPEAIAGLLKDNDYDARKTLAQTGEAIQGQLQQSIIDTYEPPLSQITVMLRKMKSKNPDLVVTGTVVGEAAARVKAGESTEGTSTKPLIDTAHLLKSADYRVK